MPQPVIDAVTDYFHLEAHLGGYEAEIVAQDRITRFYDEAARLIHAKPAEIGFIENATRAWDMVFYSLKFAPAIKS